MKMSEWRGKLIPTNERGFMEHEHEAPDLNDFGIQDVAGATLVMVGVLVEQYIKDGYCDPIMYRALDTAKLLAGRLANLAIENEDTGTAEQAIDLVTSFQLTLMEAGEVMNRIIEEHDLPVMKNTFEMNPNHPKVSRRLEENGK
jgi:hypothetical protein